MKFEEFILSIAGGAYVQLGIVEDPFDNTKKIDLEMAKASIELIEMLKEKTKNNLTKEEEDLLESVILDLNEKYKEKISKET
ncbi:hypothetical protein DESAMIL20_230 [Desulfurella amilsii]|uniref:DUF1844 domain-containing protein n=1 Tax=Desulfurella amilsii TaxID=1562698 RepID=A0A1X4Y000_9BACT|nr:DUF1844 domain-containing protein [Desulfurella amilsii]OSS43122.1 hypothetical protein DESAMIL20_230 [Desulfurella amilsii]